MLNRLQKDELYALAKEKGRRLVRTGHHTGIELLEDYFYEPTHGDIFKGPPRERPLVMTHSGAGGDDASSVASAVSLTTATTTASLSRHVDG